MLPAQFLKSSTSILERNAANGVETHCLSKHRVAARMPENDGKTTWHVQGDKAGMLTAAAAVQRTHHSMRVPAPPQNAYYPMSSSRKSFRRRCSASKTPQIPQVLHSIGVTCSTQEWLHLIGWRACCPVRHTENLAFLQSHSKLSRICWIVM